MSAMIRILCFFVFQFCAIGTVTALAQEVTTDQFVLVDVYSFASTDVQPLADHKFIRSLSYLDKESAAVTVIGIDLKKSELPPQGLEFLKRLLVNNSARQESMTASRLATWNPDYRLNLMVNCKKIPFGKWELKVTPTFARANIRSGADPEIWEWDGVELKQIQGSGAWWLLII